MNRRKFTLLTSAALIGCTLPEFNYQQPRFKFKMHDRVRFIGKPETVYRVHGPVISSPYDRTTPQKIYYILIPVDGFYYQFNNAISVYDDVNLELYEYKS